MKYIMCMLCFVLAIILLFDLVEIKSINALHATIFFMLANIFLNMKKED